MEIKTFNSEKEWTDAAVEFILTLNPQNIALSGGSTPSPIYKALGQKEAAAQIDFYQVDERYVQKEHPDSNYKLIQESLHPKKFHYFDPSLEIEECLDQYAKALPKQLDLCILGIGPDGHTASLFPNAEALNSDDLVAHTQTEEFSVKDRLTLTFKTILNSKNLLVLIKDKPAIIKELESPKKTTQEFPALRLLSHKNLVISVLTSRPHSK